MLGVGIALLSALDVFITWALCVYNRDAVMA